MNTNIDCSQAHLSRTSSDLQNQPTLHANPSISSQHRRSFDTEQRNSPVPALPTRVPDRLSAYSISSSHRRSGSWFSHHTSGTIRPSSWRQSLGAINPDMLTVFSVFDKPLPSLQIDQFEVCNVEDKSHEDRDETSPAGLQVGRALETRNLCIAGLACGWGIAIASLGIGVHMLTQGRLPLPGFLLGKTMAMGAMNFPYPARPFQIHYFRGHQVYLLPEAVTTLIPLLLNVVLTLVLDCMNYIHSTTLRWALWYEGRLSFNSNSRLFTSAKSHAPNRWYMNIISALSLVLTYGAISVLTFDIYLRGIPDDYGYLIDTNIDGARYGLDFNGWGITGLGIGLLLQALISTWCLCCRPSMVGTWSSNPLSNAKAWLDRGLTRRPLRAGTSSTASSPSSSMAPHNKLTPQSTQPSLSTAETFTLSSPVAFPLTHQPSALFLNPSIRHIPRLMWALFSASFIWTLAVLAVALRTGTAAASVVAAQVGRTDALAFWETYGQVYIRYYDPSDRRDWAGLLIQMGVQGILTLGLHCVELLTNVTRDETTWRKASKKGGTRPDANAAKEAAGSWPAVILFAFKAVTQWVFGCAFSTNLAAFMNLLPLIALSVLLLLLALFSEYLARRKPSGPQPATYGNLQALAELVDEWHETMWWGDKGPEGSVRKAGTAGERLPPVKMDILYTGLCAELAFGQARQDYDRNGRYVDVA